MLVHAVWHFSTVRSFGSLAPSPKHSRILIGAFSPPSRLGLPHYSKQRRLVMDSYATHPQEGGLAPVWLASTLCPSSGVKARPPSTVMANSRAAQSRLITSRPVNASSTVRVDQPVTTSPDVVSLPCCWRGG